VTRSWVWVNAANGVDWTNAGYVGIVTGVRSRKSSSDVVDMLLHEHGLEVVYLVVGVKFYCTAVVELHRHRTFRVVDKPLLYVSSSEYAFAYFVGHNICDPEPTTATKHQHLSVGLVNKA
jgi:hypothetical protein